MSDLGSYLGFLLVGAFKYKLLTEPDVCSLNFLPELNALLVCVVSPS